MVFEEQTYSMLIVSGSEKFNLSFSALLPKTTYHPITCVNSIAWAKRELLERAYDFVIINAPLPDDFGTRFAMDVCNNKNMVCLLLVKADLHEEIYAKVVKQGVFILPKPTSTAMIRHALRWLEATRERLRKLENKTLSIEEKMKEIRLLNRAKWLLIDNLKMTEADAHHYIEKQAMDRCVKRSEIVKSIIKTYT